MMEVIYKVFKVFEVIYTVSKDVKSWISNFFQKINDKKSLKKMEIFQIIDSNKDCKRIDLHGGLNGFHLNLDNGNKLSDKDLSYQDYTYLLEDLEEIERKSDILKIENVRDKCYTIWIKR